MPFPMLICATGWETEDQPRSSVAGRHILRILPLFPFFPLSRQKHSCLLQSDPTHIYRELRSIMISDTYPEVSVPFTQPSLQAEHLLGNLEGNIYPQKQ